MISLLGVVWGGGLLFTVSVHSQKKVVCRSHRLNTLHYRCVLSVWVERFYEYHTGIHLLLLGTCQQAVDLLQPVNEAQSVLFQVYSVCWRAPALVFIFIKKLFLSHIVFYYSNQSFFSCYFSTENPCRNS